MTMIATARRRYARFSATEEALSRLTIQRHMTRALRLRNARRSARRSAGNRDVQKRNNDTTDDEHTSPERATDNEDVSTASENTTDNDGIDTSDDSD